MYLVASTTRDSACSILWAEDGTAGRMCRWTLRLRCRSGLCGKPLPGWFSLRWGPITPKPLTFCFLKPGWKLRFGWRFRHPPVCVRRLSFAAISRSSCRRSREVFALAVVLQALVFGAGNAYQGAKQVVVISVLGALYGVLAAWRKNLRPGMIAHTLSDVVGGLLGCQARTLACGPARCL